MTDLIQIPRMVGPRSFDAAPSWVAKVLEYTPRDRQDLLAALEWFRVRLPADWPGWADGHPLCNQFFTRMNERPPLGVELHRMLIGLDDPNLAVIVKQLASPAWEEFTAGRMTLELASRLRAGACKVELLTETRTGPVADVRVKIAERWLTIECLALQADASKHAAWRVFEEVPAWLASSGIDKEGRTTIEFLDILAPEVERRLPELKEGIQRMVDEGINELRVADIAIVRFKLGALPLCRRRSRGVYRPNDSVGSRIERRCGDWLGGRERSIVSSSAVAPLCSRSVSMTCWRSRILARMNISWPSGTSSPTNSPRCQRSAPPLCSSGGWEPPLRVGRTTTPRSRR